MGRFNADKYDPRDDSSRGTGTIAVKGEDRAVILLMTKDGACGCGCNEVPQGKGRLFCMGHDARLKGKLIRAHLGGVKVTQIRNRASAPIAVTAMSLAKHYGWEHYLEAAADRAANATPRSRSGRTRSGPQVGDIHTIKVGRWPKEAQIVGVENGHIEFRYQDGSGNWKRVIKTLESLGAS